MLGMRKMTERQMVVYPTKQQHFVQKALISNWSHHNSVEVARKDEKAILVQEKSKAPSAIYYEDYLYEHVYGFDSAESHRINGFTTRTDDNHLFSTNDGEVYCKRIEDAGLPVINLLIDTAQNGQHKIGLTDDQRESLYRYLVLQALRTPGGRKKYQYGFKKQTISQESSNEDALDSFVSNFSYLAMLGVYDETGYSDAHQMPPSVFFQLRKLISNMNGYVLTLPETSAKQFVLGDNPCVVLGKGTDVWGMLMPLSPKATFLLLSDNPPGTCIQIVACTDDWRLFELRSQFETAEMKLVFCSKYQTLAEIVEDILISKDQTSEVQNIWTLVDMLGYLNNGNNKN